MASILTKRAALFQPHKKEISGADSITLEKAITAPVNKLVVEGECVQMGTPTPTAPKEIVCNNGILRYCVNLINVIEENVVIGQYIDTTGAINSGDSNFYYTPFVPVKPNTAYTLAASSSLYFVSISEYDENQTFIKRTGTYSTKELTITTDTNTHFLRFGSNIASGRKATLAAILAITWTLNKGDHYVQPGTVYTDTSPSINLAYPRIDSDQGWYITSGAIANAVSSNRTIIIPCKPNTTYTWWHSEGRGGTRAFVLNSNDITLGQLASWAVQNPVLKEANELTTYTTGADARLLCICYGRNSTDTRTFEEQAKDFMVVEGELTAAIPYVAGHGDMVVTVRQRSKKNLFPYPTYSEMVAAPKHTATGYNSIELQLKPNTTYHLSTTYLNGYTSVGENWYGLITWDPDSNNQWWSFAHHTAGAKDGNITTGEDGKLYIRVTTSKLTQDKLDALYANAQIQLEEGEHATAFEPYEAFSYYNAASLLAVGDYKDTQDIVSGEIIRRIGIKVLDGTENWAQLTNTTGSRFLFYIDEKGNSAFNAEPVCTIATGRSNNWSDDSDLIIVRTNRNFGIMNPSNMTNTSTVEEWMAYLAAQYAAGTPVIVLYPLATPTSEQVAAQPIKTKYKFDTIIDTNGAISAKYWQPPF